MFKYLIIICGFISMIQNVSAQKYITKTGYTEFKASQGAIEPIEAKNASTTVVMNTTNGEVASLLFIKAFHFDIALMEEHFNENYMESNAFPKATFKGTIEAFDFSKLSKEGQEFILNGKLMIRNVEQPVQSPVMLAYINNEITVEGQFVINPTKFDIDIPNIVEDKISKDVIIDFKYTLVEK